MTDTGTTQRPQVRRVRWVLRLTALTVESIVWLVLSAAVLTPSGTAGRDGGWAWCIAAMVPIAVATGFVTAPARHRVARTAAVAVAVALLGWGVYALAPPSIERVDRVSAALPVPADADLLWAEQFPSDWCLEGCSSVERSYAVPDAQAALQELEGALLDDGWRAVAARWCRGGFSVSTRTVSTDGGGFAGQPQPPQGEQAMSVRTTVGC